MAREPDKLEHVLNYSFSDKSLVETALTHRSFGAKNNELSLIHISEPTRPY